MKNSSQSLFSMITGNPWDSMSLIPVLQKGRGNNTLKVKGRQGCMKTVLVLLLIGFMYRPLQAEEVKIPSVPSEMEFAGMKLKITDAARRDIQKDVDMLRKSPKYFNIKLDRVRLYFPIVEKVLKEEGIPDDFKYLSVQESALISDAVSTSNAVGFWQFKDFTGREVGLRIDRNIDERMNIVASTRGAAKYFKRHNFFFRNWVYTVLAHMTGRGGAQKYVDSNKFGDTKMTINEKTHWYIKRFLAHKIAFEKELNGSHSEGLKLVEYKQAGGKTLGQVADNFDVDEELVTKYNKWLKRGKVPTEKEYSVIVPVVDRVPKALIAANKTKTIQTPVSRPAIALGNDLNRNKTIFIKINGIQSILAKTNESVEAMAAEGGITVSRFVKYNDLKDTDPIKEGEVYYLKRKKNRAKVYYHTAEPGESLWDISQKFGIKLNRLAKMNRMSIIDQPETGRLMWLRKKRPKDVPVEIKELPTNEQIEEILGAPLNEQRVEPTQGTVEESSLNSSRNENAPQNETEPSNTITAHEEKHTVVKGETLYSISKLYNIEVVALMELNQTNGAISIGQELLLPKGAGIEEPAETEEDKEEIDMENETDVTFHVVEPGDTMYKISKKYKITVDKLLELNQKDNFDISIGEKLIIKE